MSVEPDNTAGPVVTYTVRAPCRLCGRRYQLPKGAKPMPAGVGPCCQPDLFDGAHMITATVDSSAPVSTGAAHGGGGDSPPPPRTGFGFRDQTVLPDVHDDLLNLRDVLCEGCRERPADGRLSPGGIPLCVSCADESFEHWRAWLEDPSHDWWPSDDPFGSCRHPVAGWRDTEPV